MCLSKHWRPGVSFPMARAHGHTSGIAATMEDGSCTLEQMGPSKGFPDNSTTKAMTIRVINACNNWGFKRGLISKPMKIEGGSKWENRSRVLSDSELKTLLDKIKDSTKFAQELQPFLLLQFQLL